MLFGGHPFRQIAAWRQTRTQLANGDRSSDAAQPRPTIMARIAVMKALNRNVPRVFNPERKDHHWGKRKLKRDQ
jgi:hypothetical protein